MTLDEIKKLPTPEQRLLALIDNGFVSSTPNPDYNPDSDESQVAATINFTDITKEEFFQMIL